EKPEAVALAMKAAMDAILEPFDRLASNWELGSKTECYPIRPDNNWFPRLVREEPLLARAVTIR
ncbi:MAG: hypothetical protein AB1791_06270, partial [Chloroflexota bacterium]